MVTETKLIKHMTNTTSPNAYLSVIVPKLSGPGTDTLTYVTKNFSEVFYFKKLCREKGIEYSVRYKKIETYDSSYNVRPRTNVASKIGNFIKNISL